MSGVRLSVAYIVPKSRTERPRNIQIGTEVAHVTRDSDTPLAGSKFKGQGHQTALRTAALTRDAAVTVRTYWAREPSYVASARRRVRHLGAHGVRRGAGHIVSPRAQLQLN